MISYHEVQSRLVLHEGMLLKPYICPAGYLTIGVGRNLITNPLSGKELEVVGKNYKDGISESAAFFCLKTILIAAKGSLLRTYRGLISSMMSGNMLYLICALI